MSEAKLRARLDEAAAEGRTVSFWLRDDDAVVPSGPLDRLLTLTEAYDVPLTLAVIPEETGRPLAERLAQALQVSVAVHGWSHRSYSLPPAKKQELGDDRPLEAVLTELEAGLAKLRDLYGTQCLSMLVPPWNRISPRIIEKLPSLGFACLSVFGREKPAPLAVVNSHVDIMDWHGTHGGRPAEAIFADILDYMDSETPVAAIGILTHHLVHDANAWAFLESLLAQTASHPACRWRAAEQILKT